MMIKRQSKFMGVSPQKRGRALMASATEPTSQPVRVWIPDAVRGGCCATPDRAEHGLPRGEANRRAEWPNSEGSAPGANSLRSRVGGFARCACRRRSAEGLFYPKSPCTQPFNPHRFVTIQSFKKDSNGALRPVLTRSFVARRLRLPGRPLLSFLNARISATR